MKTLTTTHFYHFPFTIIKQFTMSNKFDIFLPPEIWRIICEYGTNQYEIDHHRIWNDVMVETIDRKIQQVELKNKQIEYLSNMVGRLNQKYNRLKRANSVLKNRCQVLEKQIPKKRHLPESVYRTLNFDFVEDSIDSGSETEIELIELSEDEDELVVDGRLV
jgi:small-conductance mechanosensitive channel